MSVYYSNGCPGVSWDANPDPQVQAISVEYTHHFNARGMRRVYDRTDEFPLDGKRTYQRHMDVWLMHDGRLLARFWGRGHEVEDEAYEIFGLSHPVLPDKGWGFGESWVPQELRKEYDNWIIVNSETPRSAFGL